MHGWWAVVVVFRSSGGLTSAIVLDEHAKAYVETMETTTMHTGGLWCSRVSPITLEQWVHVSARHCAHLTIY